MKCFSGGMITSLIILDTSIRLNWPILLKNVTICYLFLVSFYAMLTASTFRILVLISFLILYFIRQEIQNSKGVKRMAETKLKKYFPLIRTREEIMGEICAKQHLKTIFDNWPDNIQEEFLDFCTGVRGGKMVYDSFFKGLMNPESMPERMEDFLSLILEQRVSVLMVLPNDGTRIAGESSLLFTDIVVELTDGSIANVEIQKIGYAFPGERSACYSADLLLRQYKRVRGKKGRKFHYSDIRRVYTIILFEHRVREFHEFPNNYIHRFT